MILDVKKLQAHYGYGRYLSNITFAVAEGDTLYIRSRVLHLGTVLLEALLGLNEEIKGEVWFEGQSLVGVGQQSMEEQMALRSRMAMVYRQRGLISLLNVGENIALPLGYHYNVSKKEIGALVHEVAKLLDIERLLTLRVDQLNETQTRLVNLARALIRKPRLILIDGILEGMPGMVETIISAIKHYQRKQEFGVVMVGRVLEFDFANRAFEMREDGLVPLKW